jgi:hypothetical protein
MSFGGKPNSDGFTRHYELYSQPKKLVVMALRDFNSSVLSIFIQSGAVKQRLLRLSRTSGRLDGRKLDFTVRYSCMFAHRGESIHVTHT